MSRMPRHKKSSSERASTITKLITLVGIEGQNVAVVLSETAGKGGTMAATGGCGTTTYSSLDTLRENCSAVKSGDRHVSWAASAIADPQRRFRHGPNRWFCP